MYWFLCFQNLRRRETSAALSGRCTTSTKAGLAWKGEIRRWFQSRVPLPIFLPCTQCICFHDYVIEIYRFFALREGPESRVSFDSMCFICFIYFLCKTGIAGIAGASVKVSPILAYRCCCQRHFLLMAWRFWFYKDSLPCWWWCQCLRASDCWCCVSADGAGDGAGGDGESSCMFVLLIEVLQLMVAVAWCRWWLYSAVSGALLISNTLFTPRPFFWLLVGSTWHLIFYNSCFLSRLSFNQLVPVEFQRHRERMAIVDTICRTRASWQRRKPPSADFDLSIEDNTNGDINAGIEVFFNGKKGSSSEATNQPFILCIAVVSSK